MHRVEQTTREIAGATSVRDEMTKGSKPLVSQTMEHVSSVQNMELQDLALLGVSCIGCIIPS